MPEQPFITSLERGNFKSYTVTVLSGYGNLIQKIISSVLHCFSWFNQQRLYPEAECKQRAPVVKITTNAFSIYMHNQRSWGRLNKGLNPKSAEVQIFGEKMIVATFSNQGEKHVYEGFLGEELKYCEILSGLVNQGAKICALHIYSTQTINSIWPFFRPLYGLVASSQVEENQGQNVKYDLIFVFEVPEKGIGVCTYELWRGKLIEFWCSDESMPVVVFEPQCRHFKPSPEVITLVPVLRSELTYTRTFYSGEFYRDHSGHVLDKTARTESKTLCIYPASCQIPRQNVPIIQSARLGTTFLHTRLPFIESPPGERLQENSIDDPVFILGPDVVVSVTPRSSGSDTLFRNQDCLPSQRPTKICFWYNPLKEAPEAKMLTHELRS
jgi:hypothetical protein